MSNRSEEMIVQEEEIDGPLSVSDTGIVQASPDADLLLADGYSSEMVHTLQDGETIKGVFLGRGGNVEVSDPNTGEMREIPTWRVRSKSGAVTINLLGASQLNARLAGLVEGTNLVISRRGKSRTARGRNVNNYLIFTKAAT